MQIAQSLYKAHAFAARKGLADALGSQEIAALVKAAREVPLNKWSPSHPVVRKAYRAMIKAGMLKAGVSTSTGYNFYDLRGPAYLLFPANTPLIQSIPKIGKVNDGAGTAAHWKATRNPNSTGVYAGVLEGQRNAISSPDELQ